MKKEKNFILLKLAGVILFVVAVFASGFLFLDKIIIPKYFGEYDIHGIKDLVNVISSLYSSPDEKELITNGYSDEDLNSGVKKLQDSGYKIENDGTILEENLEDFGGYENVILSDREFAAICNELLKTKIFTNSLADLNYINIINISILDLVVTPDENFYDEETNSYSKANVRLIVKINTADLRSQIAIQMQTQESLLKMIIPTNLYFTIDYNIDLTESFENQISGKIYINGKNEKQSEVLINLLIDFIFPEEDKMDKNKFTITFGELIVESINTLGEFSFVSNIGEAKLNGFLIG